MNIQQRLSAATADLRSRATAFSTAALNRAQARAGIEARHIDRLKESIAVLSDAGREFRKVAQRHASSFVKKNSALALAAGKDVRAVARTTYATLTSRNAVKSVRKPPATRKRAAAKAA
jgi:hypothetical protein